MCRTGIQRLGAYPPANQPQAGHPGTSRQMRAAIRPCRAENVQGVSRTS